MSTSPSEQRKAKHKRGHNDLVKYVEELAGPEEYPEGDFWISLTDAARITRTSEAMARRWVSSGRIPVKKEPVGIPPRTRLVRLSDVAKIRPIIDPTAVISGEVRKLDLPSIPRQQLQIMQDNTRITRQIELALEVFRQHEATMHAALEQVTAGLRELSEDLSSRLSIHRDELQQALDYTEQQRKTLENQVRDQAHQLEQSRDEAADQARQYQQDLERLHAEMVGQLHTAQAALQQAQQELERNLIEQANQVDQVRRDLQGQQEALVRLRQEITALVEQQVREVWTALEQVKQDQVQRNTRQEQMKQQIELVEAQTKAVQITVLDDQQHVDEMKRRLQEVWKLLQGEIAARQALEQQVQQSLPTHKRTSRKRGT